MSEILKPEEIKRRLDVEYLNASTLEVYNLVSESDETAPSNDEFGVLMAAISCTLDLLTAWQQRLDALEAKVNGVWIEAKPEETTEPPAPEAELAHETITLSRAKLDDWYIRFAAFTVTGLMAPPSRQEANGLLIEIAGLMESSPEGWGQS